VSIHSLTSDKPIDEMWNLRIDHRIKKFAIELRLYTIPRNPIKSLDSRISTAIGTPIDNETCNRPLSTIL
jgi:hypothetical protein